MILHDSVWDWRELSCVVLPVLMVFLAVDNAVVRDGRVQLFVHHRLRANS